MTLLHTLDVTAKSAALATRWYEARARRREELLQLEGKAVLEQTQRWLSVVHRLASERRRARFAFIAQQ